MSLRHAEKRNVIATNGFASSNPLEVKILKPRLIIAQELGDGDPSETSGLRALLVKLSRGNLELVPVGLCSMELRLSRDFERACL